MRTWLKDLIMPRRWCYEEGCHKFSMCVITIGEQVTFEPTGLVVEVATDKVLDEIRKEKELMTE